MLEAPKLGGEYWIIADIWEVETPVPVTLIKEAGGTFTARWQISEDYTEDYEEVAASDIYTTEAAAWAVINKRRLNS